MTKPKIPPMTHMMWLDMEMTGLDPVQNRIVETAVVVTDLKMNEIATFETAVFQPDHELEKMDDWCKKTHGKSGLVARIPHGINEMDLDVKLIELCQPLFTNEDRIILCGNSISQDRKFIDAYLPGFAKLLHYRMLDVSSFKIIFETFYKKSFKKKNKHKAIDDVRESIEEMKYYLTFLDDGKLS
jgi:oligoribonuclease